MVVLAAIVFLLSVGFAGRISVPDFGLLLLGGVALRIWFGVYFGSVFTSALWDAVALVVCAEIGYGLSLGASAIRNARRVAAQSIKSRIR